ncbi:MAG: hypothetical protein A2X56_11040 [Nitrospirae bacterium GWC2_57_13]|jgi:dihydrofolate reductase|nr:MAG: hypothetical protein A2X56_11040 [Nitrospirae bacterium GWC2_57_13]HAS53559.1 hypothetical protein [Nitrospiraceae bacterium]
MRSIYRYAAVVICLALVFAVQGAVQGADGKVIKSADGLTQITVPKDWKEMKNLNAEASIQAALARQELYVIVITESKEDFDKMTVNKYSELTRASILEALSSAKEEKVGTMTIAGRQALQYKIQGSIDNLKVVYLHTTVEGKGHFHYVLAWTLKSKYEKGKDVLQQVIKSFKEI